MKVSRKPVRVLITGDSPMSCQLLLTALRKFRRQLNVVASAVSKRDILHCFSQGNVDAALINTNLEDGHMAGLELLPELSASYVGTPTIMLMDASQEDLVVRAFSSGAKGVFCRSEKQLEMLCKCIQAVHEGQVWANSDQLQTLLKTLTSAMPIRALSSARVNLLATREVQVANLVAEALPSKEIALRLGVTEHTVNNYLYRIYNKLGISSRVELVLYVTKQPEYSQASAYAA